MSNKRSVGIKPFLWLLYIKKKILKSSHWTTWNQWMFDEWIWMNEWIFFACRLTFWAYVKASWQLFLVQLVLQNWSLKKLIYIHPYASSLHRVFLPSHGEHICTLSLSLRPSPSLCPPLFVTQPASFRLYIPCRWQWLCPVPLEQRVPQGLNPVASFLSPPAPLWHLHRVLELPHRAELCSWI